MKSIRQTQIINHIQDNQNFRVKRHPQHRRLYLTTICEDIFLKRS